MDALPPTSLEEADCLMNLAYAERDIHDISKKLSRKRALECRLRANLYELQARRAEAEIGEADLDIGRTSLAIRNKGYFVYPTPSLAIKRYGSSGEYHSPPAIISAFSDRLIASRHRHYRQEELRLTVHLD